MRTKILIIDDTSGIREDLAKYFRCYQFDVSTAGTASDGESAIEMGRPDVVLLDISLTPGGREGLEICRKIKSDNERRQILVVLMTRVPQVDGDAAIEFGADSFIRSSPLELAVVLAQIRLVIKARDTAYELARRKAEEDLCANIVHDLVNAAAPPLFLVEKMGAGDVGYAQRKIGDANAKIPMIQHFMQVLVSRSFGRITVGDVDVWWVIEESARICVLLCERHKIRLVIENRVKVRCNVTGDMNEIIACVVELITNAVQELEVARTEEGFEGEPCVEVFLSAGSDGFVILGVGDNGRGVPASVGGKLFDEEFTTRPKMVEKRNGLWLVRRRLAAFGGSIGFRTRNPRGTVFEIRFRQAEGRKGDNSRKL